jgi:thioredoxin domain-containing protein 5
MKVLPWYGLLLIVLFCAAMMTREGFESSPSTLLDDIANKKVLLLVYTTACGHCIKLKPVWDKVASKHTEKMVAIDASDTANSAVQAITSKFNVTAYPTMIVLDNGQVVEQYEGGRTEQELSAFVEKL